MDHTHRLSGSLASTLSLAIVRAGREKVGIKWAEHSFPPAPLSLWSYQGWLSSSTKDPIPLHTLCSGLLPPLLRFAFSGLEAVTDPLGH